MNNLKGKTAVITGGNSGVGAATAMLLSKSGANIVISARRQAALDEVAERIKAEGGNVLTVPTDISRDEDCKNLMKAAVEKFGGIDILVNNAGVLDTGLAPIDRFDDVEIQKIVSINQIGTMQCIRAALDYMKEGASIVNVASVGPASIPERYFVVQLITFVPISLIVAFPSHLIWFLMVTSTILNVTPSASVNL